MSLVSNRTFARAWPVIVAVGATYCALEIPSRVTLHLHGHYLLRLAIDVLVTLLFTADVFFRYARWRHLSVASARDWRMKVERHPKVWLAVDILAALPLFLWHQAGVLVVLRLVKLARVAQLMREWRHREIFDVKILRLVFFAFWLTLSAHWIACGWLSLRGEQSSLEPFTVYLSALYWAVQTLSTVGYGDVLPSTAREMAYAIGVMIFGVGVYGYVIGNVASVLSKIDPAKAHHQERLEKLDAFVSYRELPRPLQQRMREYYAYLWEKRLGYDETALLADLPPSLKTDVTLYLKRDIIEKVPLFRGAGEAFIREIAEHMRPVVYLPGDEIVRAGDEARELFFISRGRVEVIAKEGGTVFDTLGDGDFFGEIALLLGLHRTATVRAVDYCDLYRLEKGALERILSHHPGVAAQIHQMVEQRRGRV